MIEKDNRLSTMGWAKVKDAAEYAGLGERTFRGLLKKGMRHSRLPSGTILVRFDAIDEFISQYERSNESDEFVEKVLGEILDKNAVNKKFDSA